MTSLIEPGFLSHIRRSQHKTHWVFQKSGALTQPPNSRARILRIPTERNSQPSKAQAGIRRTSPAGAVSRLIAQIATAKVAERP